MKFLLIFLTLPLSANDTRLVSAIYYAESSSKFLYGIKSVKTSNPRQVCETTITNARKRFRQGDFIEFLSLTYCPGSDRKVWVRNVKFFKHQKNLPIGQEQNFIYLGHGKFKKL